MPPIKVNGIIIETYNNSHTNKIFMKYLIILFIVSFSVASFGQDNTQVDNTNLQVAFIPAIAPEEKFDITTFNGSIYSEDNFVRAQVVDKLSQRTVTTFLRYDVYRCLLYTSPSPRDRTRSRMPSSA